MAGTDNPIANLFSFFNPQDNRGRLESMGVYAPKGTHSPQQGNAQFPVAQSTPAPRGSVTPTQPYQAKPQGTQRYNTAAVNSIVQQYVDAGYDPKFAVGVAANAMIESGGDPNAYNDNEGSFGLFQHRNDRLTNLRAHAERMGANATDLGAQISFSIAELRGAERVAYDRIVGGDPQSAADYAALFDQYYERSDGKARDKRRALASQIYNDFYGEGGSPITPTGNALSFGTTLGAQDPMVATADQLPYSMGREATAADLAFDGPASMKKLNMGQAAPAVEPSYDDAILRFLRAGNPEFETPAEKSAAASYAGTIGGNLPLSMDMNSPAAGSASAGAAAGAEGGTPATAVPNDEPPKRGAVERFMDMIYGTKDDTEMSVDERKDRKRAVGLALSAGFSSLSNGSDADYEGIVAQRMELQQTRRANTALKQNAQGVSDMMVAAGYADRAQLPFMGQEGMNAAMAMLGALPSQGKAEFSLPPAYRATLAQTLLDSGQNELAQGIMTLNGDALKTMYDGVIGQQVKPAGAGGAVAMSPEQVTAGQQLLAAINPQAAAAYPHMTDEDRSKTMLQYAGVGADVQKAGGVAAVTAGVDQQVSADNAAALAAGYRSAGLNEEADAVEAAGNYEAAKVAVADVQKQKQDAVTRKEVRDRGAAVAAVIPNTIPNAAALQRAARAALTSEDLNAVYAQIKPKDATELEKLYDVAKADPEFFKFINNLSLARAGTNPASTPAETALAKENDAAVTAYIDGKSRRDTLITYSDSVRDIVSVEGFESGPLQGGVLMPFQSVLNSALGDSAPKLLNDSTMTGLGLIKQMQSSIFPIMGQELKGAYSDRESKAMMDTLASTNDSKLQMLSMSQVLTRRVEREEAAYTARIDWLSKTAGTAKAGDRNDMNKFIKNRTDAIPLFKRVTENGANTFTKGLVNGDYEPGEVVSVVGADGTTTFVVIPQY